MSGDRPVKSAPSGQALCDNIAGLAMSMAIALDLLTVGVLAVKADRTIIYANRAAQRMLTRREVVIQISGRIACRIHDQTLMLAQALRAAAQPAPAGGRPDSDQIVIASGGSGLPVAIHVVPVSSVDCASQGSLAVAMLLIADKAAFAQLSVLDAFAQCFGLTTMETRVVSEILNGEGLVQAAARLGVGATTARSHLQQAFVKTGTDKQAKLVGLVFRGAAPFVDLRAAAASAQKGFSAAA